jgi:7,8-dihydropterin-6-yl-methyl-4-(beta-D-ribofuranosyl)aminobenzene 5'-phosphate synthase
MKKITCVVDNTVQRSSLFWGEHGLAFAIETDQGCALFDTGQSGVVLSHNLEVLGLRLQDVNVLALSHAHYDHTGGLGVILSQNPGLPVYANADFLRSRYSLRGGENEFIGLSIPLEELSQQADLHLSNSAIEVLPGLWTTGEIRERPEPEGRSPHHFTHADGEWQPDPYRDDMSLVMDTQEGLVLICGCCHAGLLNTLAHVQRTFQRPVVSVCGGTHLVTADETYLEYVITVLRDHYDLRHFYLNHCTGERAYVAMVNAFGNLVKPCPVGTNLTLNSEGGKR